jgi:hypothetical protein
LVQYTAAAAAMKNVADTISFRAIVNGNEIAGSQSAATLAANTYSTAKPLPVSKSFIASFNSGDILRFQLTAPTVDYGILSGSGLGTVRPSFSCTIIHIQ